MHTTPPQSEANVGTANQKNDESGIEDTVSSKGHIYSLLVKSISHDISEEIEERRVRSQNLQRITLGIVATLIVGFVGLFSGFLFDKIIGPEIDQKVSDQIEKELSDVIFLSRVATLNFRTSNLDQKESFSKEEAESLIETVRFLHSRYIVQRIGGEQSEDIKAFGSAVETLFQNFAAADMPDFMLSLEEAAPDISKRSDVFLYYAMLTYGRKLLGAAGGVQSWQRENSENSRLLDRYQQYAIRARDSGFPELYLVGEIIIRHMAEHQQREIQELLDDVDTLNDRDKSNFEEILLSWATESFTSRPDASSQRLAERVRKFIDEYSDYSKILKTVQEKILIPFPNASLPPASVPAQD